MEEKKPAASQSSPTPALSINDVRPEEVYDRVAAYAAETDSLIALLHNTLSKAEAQLVEITAYDSRIKQLGGEITPIDPSTLQAEIEDLRKHITALEMLRDRAKADMENVRKISERIYNIVCQYQGNK